MQQFQYLISGLIIMRLACAILLLVGARAAGVAPAETLAMPRTVNGTGHTGPSEFCATSI